MKIYDDNGMMLECAAGDFIITTYGIHFEKDMVGSREI